MRVFSFSRLAVHSSRFAGFLVSSQPFHCAKITTPVPRFAPDVPLEILTKCPLYLTVPRNRIFRRLVIYTVSDSIILLILLILSKFHYPP